MKCKSLVLSLVVFSALHAWAADDEVQIQTSGGGTAAPLPADNTGKIPPSQKPPSAADFKLRANVRKAAPFWIEDSKHGAAIRINKDGTFSSEAQGGGSIAGEWKAMNNELQIRASEGGDKYSYPVKVDKKGALTVDGVRRKKNRFHLK
jgi:hypothetical protein